MTDERVAVGETTAGKGATGRPGREVTLPVETLVAGQGLVAGTAGSGMSTTPRVIADRLPKGDHGLLVADRNGRYRGLTGTDDVLTVGAGGDIRMTIDRAEPLARLVVEGSVSILLDLSGANDREADRYVASVARHLFEAAESRSTPSLLVVAEIERYLGPGGQESDALDALRRIARQGSSRGLGICGVTTAPGDVPGEFVSRCDWQVWHRLTDAEKTKVVRRELNGEFATAVRDLSDNEAFLATEAEGVRRVAFERPAAAVPDLNDTRTEADVVGEDALKELEERIDTVEGDLAATRDFEQLADRLIEVFETAADSPWPDPSDPVTGNGSAGVSSVRADGSQQEPSTATNHETPEEEDDPFAAFGAMMDDDSPGSTTTPAPETSTNGERKATDGLGALAGLDSNGHDADDGRELEADDHAQDQDHPGPESGLSVRSISSEVASFELGASAELTAPAAEDEADDARPSAVARAEAALAALDVDALAMATVYRDDGAATPADAYLPATGDDDRVVAYRTNRALRTAGVIEHVGRGYYEYCLPRAIEAACEDQADRKTAMHVRNLEQRYLEGADGSSA